MDGDPVIAKTVEVAMSDFDRFLLCYSKRTFASSSAWMMPKRRIRFAVLDSRSWLRAATWKCYGQSKKDDVYLSCRELGGAFKTSFHETGLWHTAYDPEFFEAKVRPEDQTAKGRFIDQWSAPPAIAPGVVLAFRIVTPHSAVCTPYSEASKLTPIPKPQVGHAVEVYVLILDPNAQVSRWSGQSAQGTTLVDTFSLASGRSVWIIYQEIPMPKLPVMQAVTKFFQGKTSADLKGRTQRALALADCPDGSRAIYDCRVAITAPNSTGA